MTAPRQPDFEKMYNDPIHGQIEIGRHLAPSDLENGGTEACA
jgi:hypothetical protein